MICPTCGAEVPESNLCPECGASLPLGGGSSVAPGAQEDAAFKPGDSEGYWQISFAPRPAEPVEPVESAELLAESRPATHDADIDELIFGGLKADSAPAGEDDAVESAPEASGEQGGAEAPRAPFVLAVAGLGVSALVTVCVLGIAFVAGSTFALASALPGLGFLTALAVIGLVCSVAGFVLNVRGCRSDAANPRGGAVAMLGIVGLIVGASALALLVLLNVTARQALDAANENGWDVNEVQVVQGSDGTLVVRERSEASSGTAPSSILSASSEPASSPASSSASSAAQNGSASSASASSVAAPSGSLYFDAQGNPTLRSLIELNGTDLQELLKSGGFRWYDEIGAWLKSNGAVFQVVNRNGNVTRDDIDKLAAGAVGAPVAFVLSAEGYATRQQALTALAEGVTVEERHESDGAVFAVVRGAAGEKYLVLATSTGDSEQTLLVYGETAIKEGLFRETIGIDVGSSVTDAWGIVAG